MAHGHRGANDDMEMEEAPDGSSGASSTFMSFLVSARKLWDDWERGQLARPDPAGKLPALPVLPHAYNFSQETVVWVRGPTGSAGGPPAWYSIHDDGGANPRGHDGSGRAARAPRGCAPRL